MKVILLKLGGSVITDKSKPYTARAENIKQIVSEVKQALHTDPDLRIILGHGAGSFAHQSAKKYNTIDGFTTSEERFGATVVRYDVMQLNTILIKECIGQQIPVFSLQPSAFIMSENKKPAPFSVDILLELLKKNIIPCVFGDVIVDTQLGSTIYSTDTIFALLAEKLIQEDIEIDKIIHAGNYDGVLDVQGNVISEITPRTFDEMKEGVSSSHSVDVTGGMLKKVEESLKLTKMDITSVIIRGNKESNIIRALTTTDHIGTSIRS